MPQPPVHWRWGVLAGLLLLVPLILHSQSLSNDLAKKVARRPEAKGTVVVPESFLRRWDAITVFFDKATGPRDGGPEDHPEKVVQIEPSHPGAWTWLDDRTLQFRPATPWRPLEHVTITADGDTHRLATLMAAPLETIPANNATDLVDVDAITLTFADPIEPGALARMIDIELRPLPGVDETAAWHLTRHDFSIKALPRETLSAPARYVVALDAPIPPATRVILSFRLSLEDSDETLTRVTFATAAPFHVTGIGCGSTQLPVDIGGTRYDPAQALHCSDGNASLVVTLSASLGSLDPFAVRRFVRIDPPVDNREFSTWNNSLTIRGDFVPGRLYRVHLTPAPLEDAHGRHLEMGADSEVYLSFPEIQPALRWGASRGVIERFGPQMVPLEGHGYDRADLRIYAIPPLERSLWPFPDQPVPVDESRRPPGPGEAPPPIPPDQTVTPDTLAAYIATLGSPPVSTLVDLHPIEARGAHRFGLDLGPYLEAIEGRKEPGTYLVGIRPLDQGTTRSWIRVQVTDLSVSTAEEPDKVVFVVTSLSKGTPVSSAEVVLEGVIPGASGEPQWSVLARLVTDRQGEATFDAPGEASGVRIRRIVVRKGDDTLVLDPERPPEAFQRGFWTQSPGPWLQWAFEDLRYRGPEPAILCHVFPERPVYRPDEPVHIKGYVRRRDRGKLSIIRPDATLTLEGPGGMEWDFGQYITETGSFYFLFDEDNMPAGTYTGYLDIRDKDWTLTRCGHFTFRKEAYRLPSFEVRLHGPDKTPLDKPFEVTLSATYYAGGPVAGRPVRWRVTQYPYTFEPPRQKGFLYSSDGRFSRPNRFESTPQLTREDVTDADGVCRLRLDPTLEPTAQPRTYVVEATVTGNDDRTVTDTRQIVSIPPFVVGVRAPRFVTGTDTITPDVVMVGPDGALIPDRQVVVRLISRQWQSHLQAGDFSDGVARYLTDVVDTNLSETLVITGREPVPVPLTLPRAGVYLVEVEARDALGRAQVVSVDLYASGDEPVTWRKPEQRVVTVSADQPRYDPGATAHLVIQSPFQKARALVVVEAPEGNAYQWVRVRGGAASIDVPILGTYAPRVPVHVVVMRGRVDAPLPSPSNLTDLGKPTTVAATTWLTVNPRDNELNVELEYPDKVLPGETIPVTIRLSDPDGRPQPGEVTLWLVDQAVLALGKEQRLDPLPDFIPPRASYWLFRDTRDLPFGLLPVAMAPGGGEGSVEAERPWDHVTVRRNFAPVAYYHPEIRVRETGVAMVQVPLTDDLTNFKIRAKAISGEERFGYATGMVSVRLPVLVQPDLPRFVRPGDQFLAQATARVLEGPEGDAAARIRVDGAELTGKDSASFTLDKDTPTRLTFPVTVPETALADHQESAGITPPGVTIRMQVQRLSDAMGDGFEVTVPLIEDRQPVVIRRVSMLTDDLPFQVDALPATARPGSVQRVLQVSNQPALAALAKGLDVLLGYPFGCTEQRVSRARAILATRAFRTQLGLTDGDERLDAAVRDVLDWIPRAVTDQGLVAYWPGGRGYVSLTAWTLEFLEQAARQDYPVDESLRRTLKRALRRSLASDTYGLIDGEEDTERTMALLALTEAGSFDPGYAAELTRRAAYLNQESKARIALALSLAGRGGEGMARDLAQDLWHGVVIEQREGQPVFAGLRYRVGSRNEFILPSEIRTLALTIQALHHYQPEDARLPALIHGLEAFGRDGSWETTNANAAAMAALADVLEPPLTGGADARIRVRVGHQTQTLEVSGSQPVAQMVLEGHAAGEVQLTSLSSTGDKAQEIVVSLEARYLPGEDGGRVEAASQGFVVTRSLVALTPDGSPAARYPLERAATTINVTAGDLVEEHVEVINPEDSHHVAIVVPLAAGFEPLNPQLATAPPEARPSRRFTGEATNFPPTHTAMLDDRVAFYYDTLPKGTYGFRFRTRATVPGRYIQPPASAQKMYDLSVRGNSPGAYVVVAVQGK